MRQSQTSDECSTTWTRLVDQPEDAPAARIPAIEHDDRGTTADYLLARPRHHSSAGARVSLGEPLDDLIVHFAGVAKFDVVHPHVR